MADSAVPPDTSPRLVATPVRQEIERLLSLPRTERESRLLESRHLGAVVAMLPPEELFFTLREMDPENVPTVLAHARPEQVEFLLDLELWRKDRVRRDRILPWLERLAACGDEPLLRWLRHLDVADLTLLLGKLVRVHLADEDRDPLQDLTRRPFTLDGFYFVAATERAEPPIQKILTLLREADEVLYQRLMEAVHRDPDAELEEHCFLERQRRLAVRGFPEWEEAMEVYARLEPRDAAALPARPGSEGATGATEPHVAPRYSLAGGEAIPDLLGHCLGSLGGEALEAFRAELAHLTNKVAVADGLDLDDPNSFEVTLRKVANYVSIGLEALAGTDDREAVRLLRRQWAQHLFRVGWTQVREVRGRARRLFDRGWPQARKERLLLLDTPLPETLEGLLRPHPLWYAAEAEPTPYRLFRTVDEVRQADWRVGKADFLGRFLTAVVDLRLRDLKGALVDIDTDNLKGTTVFLTALVNAALGRDFRFAPVDREAVRRGLTLVWEDDRPPRRAKAALHDAAVQWSKGIAGVSDREEGYLREFVRDCFTVLEEEFGRLAPDEIPDPRFVRGLWIA